MDGERVGGGDMVWMGVDGGNGLRWKKLWHMLVGVESGRRVRAREG